MVSKVLLYKWFLIVTNIFWFCLTKIKTEVTYLKPQINVSIHQLEYIYIYILVCDIETIPLNSQPWTHSTNSVLCEINVVHLLCVWRPKQWRREDLNNKMFYYPHCYRVTHLLCDVPGNRYGAERQAFVLGTKQLE